MNTDLYARITAEFADKRRRAGEAAEARAADASARISGLADLDSAIRDAGNMLTRMTISGDPGAAAKRGELRGLRERRAALLAESGLSDEDFRPRFGCAACGDTGTLPDGGMCGCFRNRAVELMNEAFGGKLGTDSDFARFREDLFSGEADAQKYRSKLSPRENIALIKTGCERFLDGMNDARTRNLYFSGPTGTGKTFLAGCVAREALNRGYSVVYQSAPAMFEAINKLKYDEDDDGDGLKEFISADLLIIDDLGTENRSGAKYTELLNILTGREAKNAASPPCKTIISSNLGLKELYKYYDERIVSRIAGGFEAFMFFGEDLRIKLRRS